MAKNLITYLLPILLLTIGAAPEAFGQNYRPFSKGNMYRFDSPTGYYSVKIDSATLVTSDSTFWFNKIVVDVPDTFPGNNCGYPAWQGPAYSYGNENVFGTKMVEKLNGQYQFIGENGDTIFIHTQAPLLSSWTFLSDSSLTAMITSRSLQTFLGITDSVISISVSNGEELRLSKNHGIQSIHNFRTYWTGTPINVFQLRRLPSRPNFLSFFDFDIGDRFGYFQGAILTGAIDWTEYHDGYVVLSRQDFPNGDSIGYSINRSRRRRGRDYIGISFDTIIPTDTVNWMFKRSMYQFLELGTMDHHEGILFRGANLASNLNGRETFTFTHFALDTCNETLNWSIDGGNAQNYTIGLGETLDGSYGVYERERVLTCYVKQTDSITACDFPLVGIREPQFNELTFNIYPNPLSDFTTLQFVNARGLRHELIIYNQIGQAVCDIKGIIGDQIRIERGNLPAGLYLLVLKSSDGKEGIGKLFVK